ncbi:unnamed protein product [Effrenium voratum]|uniref:Uncharacterized protein n=1 Tax=Effrenium voratum TaxID=2562239 RepID=A0AA36ICR3_9DINO|nr:unnamed protein product [Effrenium voratum]CAJ1454967.1 unnamed protein product [Effrenium voratum]CAJ1459606.1 unnamed protein product [Effrenium voratum]
MAMSKATQTNGHEIYGSRPTVYSGMELVNEWHFTLAALQGTTPFPDGINTRGEAWAHLVCTEEEFNSLQSDSQITFLRADFRMPAWDKAILSLNPSDGINVMSYHLTELHTATRRPNVWILLSFQIDFAHLANMQSYDQVRMFNRGFSSIYMQLEGSSIWKFTPFELAHLNAWSITRSDGQSNLDSIINRATWANGYLWSFSVPINMNQIFINGSMDHLSQDEKCRVVKLIAQALEYTGMQCLVGHPHYRHIIMVAIDQRARIAAHGCKDEERLRGSSRLASYIQSQSTEDMVSQIFAAVNQWRELHWIEEIA